ncbi:MAG: hypothetical protein DRR16_31415, partial [Candidatus Parabeggiatoa sp. nov. 3]
MMNKLLIRKLQEAVEIKSEIAIKEQVQKIGVEKVVEAVPYLIALHKKTDNCKLRNIIALALSDIGDQRA